MRPKGSPAVLEQRRRNAVALLKQGLKPAMVAEALKVSSVSVGRWKKALDEGGVRALAAKPVPGRPSKLDPAQRRQIGQLLLKGPAHFGYQTQLWTLERIAEVIEKTFDVTYDPSQVWRILLSLGWSCQKPESRARERDEKAIARWRKVDWPRIKKSRKDGEKRAVSG
jgi:transposase